MDITFHVIEGASTSSFNLQMYLDSSLLLKDEDETPSVTWNIMLVVNCRPGGGVCRLC